MALLNGVGQVGNSPYWTVHANGHIGFRLVQKTLDTHADRDTPGTCLIALPTECLYHTVASSHKPRRPHKPFLAIISRTAQGLHLPAQLTKVPDAAKQVVLPLAGNHTGDESTAAVVMPPDQNMYVSHLPL